ncbi:MAG TPA: hypothetical protein P5052_04700 [Candidatus Paceibacterota bacterium]|nr:hypothetical protein [Candidatus Paceibacterota bacterium]
MVIIPFPSAPKSRAVNIINIKIVEALKILEKKVIAILVMIFEPYNCVFIFLAQVIIIEIA